jgi:4-hydroxy-3-methylbut-2-en-1-yl diphosphate reductase
MQKQGTKAGPAARGRLTVTISSDREIKLSPGFRPPPMKIIRAEHLGMCFGVRDAIALATKQSASGPLTILGDLVHNENVLADLRARGVTIEEDAANAKTSTVMVTAHGASGRALRKTRALGLNVLEATCPLVRVAHHAVARLVRDGFHPVIIGKRDHVEVRGLTEDLAGFDVVLSEDDVQRLAERPRFGVAAQTTQPIEKVRHLLQLIRERFPASEVRFVDTVCQPTKQRQSAAIELARRCDVVVVIGGAHSNNTRELVSTCSRYCSRVHHVQTAADLQSQWLDGAETVGITAGTSTPDSIIESVERAIQRLAAISVPFHAHSHA